MKKTLRETQTLRAEPKIFAPPQTTFPGGGGAGRPKFNQLEMTYKLSLVKIDARNFELSW